MSCLNYHVYRDYLWYVRQKISCFLFGFLLSSVDSKNVVKRRIYKEMMENKEVNVFSLFYIFSKNINFKWCQFSMHFYLDSVPHKSALEDRSIKWHNLHCQSQVCVP